MRAKLLSAFAVVTVLTLVLGFFAMSQQSKIFNEVKTSRNVYFAAGKDVTDLTEATLLERVNLLRLTIAADPATRDDHQHRSQGS